MKLDCYLHLASSYLKTKNYDSAITACRSALTLDPSNVLALQLRAIGYMAEKEAGSDRLDLAVEDLRQALLLDPENKPVRIQLVAA